MVCKQSRSPCIVSLSICFDLRILWVVTSYSRDMHVSGRSLKSLRHPRVWIGGWTLQIASLGACLVGPSTGKRSQARSSEMLLRC